MFRGSSHLSSGLLALGIASGAFAALAQTRDDYLAIADLDRDGRLALGEYQAYLSQGFRDMDRNRDGRLEGEELPVPGRALLLHEHLASLAAQFRRQDRDRDGYLSAAEFTAAPR
jgi:hypothetical protein